MAKPTKAIHEGKQVDAEEMNFQLVGAPEVTLQVEDGTTLKIMLMPAKVVKLKDVYNTDGEPVYQLKWGTGVSASVPADQIKIPETPQKQ